MRVLVACEESQAVCKAFRARGHEAYSCDLIPCSGGHPEWHIQQDAIHLINGDCDFYTCDGTLHSIHGKWDLLIAHPPCTNLAISGARWFPEKIADGRQQASIDFFMAFVNADCPRIAIENPIGIMSTKYRKPDQIIHPWWFGELEEKSTCLWLKGLPKLIPTNDVREKMLKLPKKQRERLHYLPPSPDGAKIRSKTFPGIAEAMAEQWGGIKDAV